MKAKAAESESAASDPPPPRGSGLLRALGWLNVWGISAACLVLWMVGERWWVGTILTYVPRAVLMLPGWVLGLLSLPWDRRATGLHVVAVGIVAFPLMGFVVPIDVWRFQPVPRADALRVVTCNVQGFGPEFETRLAELTSWQPDVLVLQEADPLSPLVTDAFPEWSFVKQGKLVVGSRFPVRLMADVVTEAFARRSGILVEIESPGGVIELADIHPMTPRPALLAVTWAGLKSNEWPQQVHAWEVRRREELRELRREIDLKKGQHPLIIAGDFNRPVSSPDFREHFGDLQDSFGTAGFGWGPTAPRREWAWWPDHRPWVRIDHVLCSPEWTVLEAHVGTSAGSDHQAFLAVIQLNEPAHAPPAEE